MTDKRDNQSDLNARRRQAVQMRLQGQKIADIRESVDLSAPTIIAAHKMFLQGGWPAVDAKPRGRPAGHKKGLSESMRATLLRTISAPPPSDCQMPGGVWTFANLHQYLKQSGSAVSSPRTIGKYVDELGYGASNLLTECKQSNEQIDWFRQIYAPLVASARKSETDIFWAGFKSVSTPEPASIDAGSGAGAARFMYAHGTKGQYCWLAGDYTSDVDRLTDFFFRLANHAGGSVSVILHGMDVSQTQAISSWIDNTPSVSLIPNPRTRSAQFAKLNPPGQQKHRHSESTKSTSPLIANKRDSSRIQRKPQAMPSLTHLQRLEAESIHIMREIVADADNPVMLYSIGKDSAVMLHLAMKAFYPAKPPFPLLHVDTGWKFQAMYEFRDNMVKDYGLELITHTNPEGLEKGVNPFTHGSALHTDIMKTQGLRQALDKHGFDAAFGGARRDEEKSRAKERIFSFRNAQHRWDPKNQRPELWNLYNARKQKGESIRVFPISNWTELDVWQYIHLEKIPIVPLYLSAERPVVMRDGTLIMVDDDRLPMNPGEVPMMKNIRFRTLGCYPLTGAIESSADTLPGIIQEMLLANTSERQGRMIDHDSTASMEKKKQEGYF